MNGYDFGTILRQLRKSKNLTQAELGSFVGLSKAVVSKYENGLGYPAYDILIRIADYFGVTTDYLLGRVGGRTVDITDLNDTQADLIYRMVTELKTKK